MAPPSKKGLSLEKYAARSSQHNVDGLRHKLKKNHAKNIKKKILFKQREKLLRQLEEEERAGAHKREISILEKEEQKGKVVVEQQKIKTRASGSDSGSDAGSGSTSDSHLKLGDTDVRAKKTKLNRAEHLSQLSTVTGSKRHPQKRDHGSVKEDDHPKEDDRPKADGMRNTKAIKKDRFYKERMKFQKEQELKKTSTEERIENQKEYLRMRQKSKRKRSRENAAFQRKNEKGQPKLKYRMEKLLERIQST